MKYGTAAKVSVSHFVHYTRGPAWLLWDHSSSISAPVDPKFMEICRVKFDSMVRHQTSDPELYSTNSNPAKDRCTHPLPAIMSHLCPTPT